MMITNSTIWITGASSGIGAALAAELDNEGNTIVLSARSTDKLETLSKSFKKAKSYVVPIDLSNPDSISEAMKRFSELSNHLDILINNGGISQRATARETSMEVERKIMEVNYFGTINLTKQCLPFLEKSKQAKILVISSIAGKFGFFLRGAYSASKHALHGYFESLRLEEEKNNIQVTIACPGKINTNISVNALSADGKSHGVMDHNQSTGMNARKCAKIILRAMRKGKREVLVGGKEVNAVIIKRFLPNLFHRIIRKQPAT